MFNLTTMNEELINHFRYFFLICFIWIWTVGYLCCHVSVIFQREVENWSIYWNRADPNSDYWQRKVKHTTQDKKNNNIGVSSTKIVSEQP